MPNKVLAVDLDGTLMYPRVITHAIPLKNRRFVKNWIDEGNKLVLVTSRTEWYCKKLSEEIKRPYDYISNSCGKIVANGEVIKDTTMNNQEIKAILDELNETFHPLAFIMTTDEYPNIIRQNRNSAKLLLFLYKAYWWFSFKRREPFILDNELFEKEINSGNVYKVVVFFGIRKKKNELAKEINKILRNKFPNIESSWSGIINELTPVNCNKGEGVRFYCEHTNVKPEDIYVVGDSGNDISMFNAYHENSYVMAKAYPSVKKYAAHVIPGVYKLGKLVLKKEKK